MLEFFSLYDHLFANAMIFAIAALSVYFSLRAGVYNLSQVGLMAIGAYSSALLTMEAELPWLLSVIIGTAIGTGIGVLLAYPVIRLRGHFLAIATLGFGAVVPIIALNLRDLTGGASGLVGIPVKASSATVIPFLVLCLLLALRLFRSRPGRAWDAIRLDEAAAVASGIHLAKYKLQALLLSSLLAALAGGLFALANRVLVPSLFGFGLLTDLLVFTLLGGIGYPLGPVVGAVLVSTMPEWLAGFERYREFLLGGLLIVAVVYTPGGLVQLVRTAKASFFRRADHRPSEARARAARHPASPGKAVTDIMGSQAAPRRDGGGGENLLSVDSLTKSFGGLAALQDVDLHIAPGQVVALIGPNGAGKTTLVNCVTGLVAADAGNVVLRGQHLETMRPDERSAGAGLVRTFQSPRLLADLSVEDNVLIGLHHHTSEGIWHACLPSKETRSENRQSRERAQQCLDYVGYVGNRSSRARELSYGDQRRVELARALAMQPQVLLLDEPAAGLSHEEVDELKSTITDLTDNAGIGVLLIDHNMQFVMDVADRVYVLSFGELIADGTPNDVRSNPDVIRVYLGGDPATEGQAADV